ncbi:hypothetical protein MRX96_046948 [Rhipicephalus microplus]
MSDVSEAPSNALASDNKAKKHRKTKSALLEDDREDKEQELALRYAIDRINNNNAILPASRLRLLTQRLPPGDAFHAFKTGAWRLLWLFRDAR